jgi:hypothetical protein
MNLIKVAGYHAKIEYNEETNQCRGEILELYGGPDFYGSSSDELRREFKKSLGVFLEVCKQQGNQTLPVSQDSGDGRSDRQNSLHFGDLEFWLIKILTATIGQDRQIQILVNLANIVFGGQHAMHVLVHRHPAVAFRIGARAIELPRRLGQGDHQGIGRLIALQRLRNGGLRNGGQRNRGHRRTIGSRGIDVRGGHHNAGVEEKILAQPAD